ncbi:MAG: hypothetical protein K0V04_42805 [Deltaproteobacteria bacterium]|nr:hypothetical protein [Deltaproteobacteria bacterium]
MDELDRQVVVQFEPLADQLEPVPGGDDADTLEDLDFRLQVSIDVQHEKALVLRVLLVVEVVFGLVLLREMLLLFVLT